ncbi:MAG: cation:proton antiporter [Methylophilaceae bacterium]|jgi:CPA2 family monovalent cation:H+ antiporter-2|nr:cation:proton antiporter [Methylophilaceae bacterium]
MLEQLAHILMLLGTTVAVIVAFQRLHIPTSLGYLLVGIVLGPHAFGGNINLPDFNALAEFGVVFLLFAIGLNYSLPQLHALRHQVLGLGTAQVILTTIVVAILLWLAGWSPVMAFVIGAVFAQSSSTIIASLLTEQGEENSQHGRLGLAMSIFQDVTAVPFLVIIPVLGAGIAANQLAGELAMVLAKAVLAFALVFFAGRWLLRPLFHLVTQRRSPELFTLTVLLVALMAAWSTSSLGLSLAFGAFLVGMMLGETEFRVQVESSIRPFRDVLLGLFFIGIGMMFNPLALVDYWHYGLIGAAIMLVSKAVMVSLMVRASGITTMTSVRTGLILSVGGEFGFALLAIALQANVIDEALGQMALLSILFSMILGAFLIRFNKQITAMLFRGNEGAASSAVVDELKKPEQEVLIAGYGRVGHTIAVLLQHSGIDFIVLETDPKRVAVAKANGHRVLYGDISDAELLNTVHAERAALVVMAIDDPDAAAQAVRLLKKLYPQVPVIARAKDLEESSRLLEAGALQAHPEIIEASLRLGAAALHIMSVPEDDIETIIQDVRDWDYQVVADKP